MLTENRLQCAFEQRVEIQAKWRDGSRGRSRPAWRRVMGSQSCVRVLPQPMHTGSRSPRVVRTRGQMLSLVCKDPQRGRFPPAVRVHGVHANEPNTGCGTGSP